MLDSIQSWFLSFIAGPGGYVGLFLFGAIATTFIPLSPEVVAIAVWKSGMPVIPTIAVLTIGNYLGNALNYWLGRVGEFWILEKYFRIKKKHLDRAHRWFNRFGPPILLLSWLPVVGDPLTFVPGVLKYKFWKFSIYVIIGKVIRYVGLYYLFAWWI